MRGHIKERLEICHYYWHAGLFFHSTFFITAVVGLGWVGLGLGLAKQWISLLRPVLGCFAGLIHHIRVWEPRKWPTDISLTKGLMSEADGHSI